MYVGRFPEAASARDASVVLYEPAEVEVTSKYAQNKARAQMLANSMKSAQEDRDEPPLLLNSGNNHQADMLAKYAQGNNHQADMLATYVQDLKVKETKSKARAQLLLNSAQEDNGKADILAKYAQGVKEVKETRKMRLKDKFFHGIEDEFQQAETQRRLKVHHRLRKQKVVLDKRNAVSHKSRTA
eukprot:6900756-Pyramimonas_sp.AAC.1